MKKTTLFFMAAIVGLVLSACSKSSSDTALTCSVSSATVQGTNQLLLSILASGGTANYQVTGVTANSVSGSLVSGGGSFASSVSTTAQFSSLTSTTLSTATGTVSVSDGASATASCSYSVGTTSTTGTYSSGAISCTLAASTTTPSIGTATTFYATAISGGTAPYTFSNFTPGSNGTTTGALTAVSNTQAQATATYSVAGTSTAQIQVADSAGNYGTCSTVLSVGGTGTSGGLSCQTIVVTNPVYRNQYTTIYPQLITNGAGNVYVVRLDYPSSSGFYGYFTNSYTVQAKFSVAGTWAINFVVQDAAGTQAYCPASVVVQ